MERPAMARNNYDAQWYTSCFAKSRRLLHFASGSKSEWTGQADMLPDIPELEVLGSLKSMEECRATRVVHTRDGRLRLTPKICHAGDVCCVLPGVSVPFLLRRTKRNTYNLVGVFYLYGVMRSELMEQLDRGKFNEETTIIE
jgi:hypothetical protein